MFAQSCVFSTFVHHVCVFFIVPPEFGFGLNVGLVDVNVLLEVKSAALLSFEDVIDKLSY